MKKIYKLSALVLALVMLCAMLCACGDNSNEKNVPVSEIAANVANAIEKNDALTSVDANWIKGWMKTDAEKLGEYVVMVNAYGANVDEFGVFKAGEMSTSEIKTMLENYLKLRMDSWMDEYMPEEKPKLESAEIKVNGSYVIYCILSDSDSGTAFATFEEALK